MMNTGLTYEKEKSNKKLGFEDTELRLGLPNGGEKTMVNASNLNYGKRGFEKTISVDLKLNLDSKDVGLNVRKCDFGQKDMHDDSIKPPPKAQVVGWPPVGSFRKNMMAAQKVEESKESEKGGGGGGGGGGVAATAFVKVSMDGAPYLRKVDLKMYKGYQELSEALGKMFGTFTIGKCDTQGGMMDFMNERKVMDLFNSSDYVPTYEDKDGDWMHVGDVPWEMFVESCKRLRIMKGTEAKGLGLAARAMEMQEQKLK